MRRIEVDLSPDERRELVLWLNEGEKITVITHRLQVRRQMVYNWRKDVQCTK